MSMKLEEQLRALGFEPAGAYQDGRFTVSANWTNKQAIYLWTEGDGVDRILRVGKACGKNGLISRHKHYNRWLAGFFKPRDLREQKARSVFANRLHSNVILWARRVSDNAQALEEERQLRARFGKMLDLDLMVKDGWGALEMASWRAAGRPPIGSS